MEENARSTGREVKWAYIVLALMVLYAIVRSIVAASVKTFWYDELLTLTVASLQSPREIWRALAGPLDGQPPLFYLIEKAFLGWTVKQEVALRLPSIIALPCTLICVFLYARRKAGEWVGLLCAAFLLTTTVFQLYAVEARPYSMVVACMAFALVCYQRAPASIWMAMMAASFFAAQSLHYLAVLSIVPFGLAELAVLCLARRFRAGVWAALIFGAAPMLIFWKLIAINKSYYGGPNFWAKFPFSFIPNAYGEYFVTSGHIGFSIAAAAIAAVVIAGNWPGGIGKRVDDAAEVILLGAIVALPFLGYSLTKFIHSGITPRYVLATVLGVVLAAAYALGRSPRSWTVVAGIFVCAGLGVQELHFWRFPEYGIKDRKVRVQDSESFLRTNAMENLPIVFPNGGTMFEMMHYALDQKFTNRFVYLAPSASGWPDTTYKGFLVLRSYLPSKVGRLSTFTTETERFFLYAEDLDVAQDVLTATLVEEGWSQRVVACDGYRALFLVERTGQAAKAGESPQRQ